MQQFAADTPVLVAVVNNLADWRRIEHEHWYRIPLNRAPRHMTAHVIAWYQTKIFGEHGNSVRWYAPIEQCQHVTRRDLIPSEPDHPRAEQRYWRIGCGDLQALPRPIPATTFKRVTFIPTRWENLLHAQTINDLWLADALFADMCQQLQADGYSIAKRRLREHSPDDPLPLNQIELHATLNCLLVQSRGSELRIDWSDLVWQPQECLALVRAFLQR